MKKIILKKIFIIIIDIKKMCKIETRQIKMKQKEYVYMCVLRWWVNEY